MDVIVKCERCPVSQPKWSEYIQNLRVLQVYMPGKFTMALTGDTLLIKSNESNDENDQRAFMASRESTETYECVIQQQQQQLQQLQQHQQESSYDFAVIAAYIMLTEIGGTTSLTSNQPLEWWWPYVDRCYRIICVPTVETVATVATVARVARVAAKIIMPVATFRIHSNYYDNVSTGVIASNASAASAASTASTASTHIMRSIIERNDLTMIAVLLQGESTSIYRKMGLHIVKKLRNVRNIRINLQISAWVPRLVQMLQLNPST